MRKIIRSKLEEVAICPNTDLRFLPREIADRKISALGVVKDFLESN
jgi:methionine synthase II (cobalamin-independent)